MVLRALSDDDVELVTVNLVKPCRFTHDDGRSEHFTVGEHEVPRHVAEHWFFASHSDNPPAPDLKPGTPEYVAERAEDQRRQRLLAAAETERRLVAQREAMQEETKRMATTPRRRVGPERIELEQAATEAELHERIDPVDRAEAHGLMVGATKAVQAAEGRAARRAALVDDEVAPNEDGSMPSHDRPGVPGVAPDGVVASAFTTDPETVEPKKG